MKRFPFITVAVILLLTVIAISCTKEKAVEPCDGKGTINIENKLDSTITVKIVQTHTTKSIPKDYTLPFTLAGNQPYTINIDGPQYNRDTTIMLLSCDNKLLIVIK